MSTADDLKLPNEPATQPPATPGTRWRWWISEAATQFSNGMLKFPDVGIGASSLYAAADAPTWEAADLANYGVKGFIALALLFGVRELIHWHRQNPMPNPFFSKEPK